jgi:beta-galactosidase
MIKPFRMRRLRRLLVLTLCVIGASGLYDSGVFPLAALPAESSQPASSEAPVTTLSARRADMLLDGVWRFTPAQGNNGPTTDWGSIRVPGSWMRDRDIVTRGDSPFWEKFAGRQVGAAWYERPVAIPADWAGRAIILDFHRVSTDATVYVDDKAVGKVAWPEGTVDITAAVTPGRATRLRVFVVAATDQKESLVLMGQAPGQTYSVKTQLASGGLIGSVTLHSLPRGARVESVGVETSTRKKRLDMDIELSGFSGTPGSGTVEFVASLRDEKGQEEKRFAQRVDLADRAATPSRADGSRTIRIGWPWENPRLWDLGQPNRYTLHLSAKGAGIDDEFAQPFGFREFWIEGRKIFLNGTEFRLRPTLGGDDFAQALRDGFNISESWPEDIEQRGSETRYTAQFDKADAVGFPITGILPHMGWQANNVDTPAEEAAYLAAARRVIRRYRNHPSLVMWGTSGNMYGGPLDPAYVGMRAKATALEVKKGSESGRKYPIGDRMIARIKEIDPTRPVFIHNGGPSGDIYTINNYLNFIPLQEREEWLSHYAKNGDMPLWYVEFGTPVSLSVMRGRNGFSNAVQSEILMSEYSAIYLGSSAYKQEPEAYRRRSAELFDKDQTYKWSHALKERDYAPAWLALQDQFIRGTWRAWRAWGITGGMIPWDAGYARLDGKVTVAGEALHAGNSPTLAWIAGAQEFTAKDHHFTPGQSVRKQVVLINDTRAAQPYSLTWTSLVNGKQIAQGKSSGKLAVAETRFVPFSFVLPAAVTAAGGGKLPGEIVLTATVGSQAHADTFRFTLFTPTRPRRGSVVVFDPRGKSTALLTRLGYTVTPWNGKPTAQTLVIGREALSRDGKMPGDLEAFVRRGGRAILFEQDPYWVREKLGLRASYLQSRRVFRVGASPVTANLGETDLRDWNGASTLLDAYPDYARGGTPDTALSKTNQPYAGWRWGNRHTVASAAIEKPHRSGWRPLLECEFDLAYSPLMELDYGAGRLVWCQLDLEDHAPVDPAARRLAFQVMEYARTAPLSARKATLYIGDAAGKAKLDALGLVYRRADRITPGAGLVVIGGGAAMSPAALEAFARRGGRVLVLPQTQTEADGGRGVRLTRRKSIGSLEVPAWSETRGLSASDLRWRNEADAWLVASGAEIGAGGQIGRRRIGKGVVIFCQIDPDRFDADTKTYFRLTRWRQTRALSQLLANLGGSFEMDRRVFYHRMPVEMREPQVTLAGPWQARLTVRRSAAATTADAIADPGISSDAKAQLAGRNEGWQTVQVPGAMENYGGAWTGSDGEAVFRKVVEVPTALRGKALTLSLGTLDDYDDTYFNGVRVGGLGSADKDPWGIERRYTIPANLVKPGSNVITIRVWDRYGGGGFTSNTPTNLVLKAATAATDKGSKPAGFYHPDYREDFDLGDEPYRYYNW